MPVAVAYLSGNTLSYEPGIFKRGTIGFNLSTSLQGNYNWWNAVDQDANKLLIYSDTFSTSATSEANAIPSAWATTDLTDASLLGVINSVPELIGQPKFTSAKDALTWLQGRGIYFIVKDGYENIVTNGLVLSVDAGWYSSYPGSGTAITDISGEGNNGVLVGVPVFQSGNGGTLNFDGADDRITFSNTLTEIGLINQSPASFEAWVKFNSLSTYMHIIDGSDNCFHLAVESSGAGASIYFWNGETFHGTAIPVAVVGEWYHIVGVQETSENKIYINGQLAINGTLSSGASNLVTSGSKYLALGYWQGNTGRYLNGNLAIARVYNRALTASEIQQNYNAQSYRFGSNVEVSTMGLVTNLDASQSRSYPGSGTVWYDLSSYNKDATLINGPTYNSNGWINFDGADDYAQGSLEYANNRDIAISGLVNITLGTGGCIAKVGEGCAGFAIGIGSQTFGGDTGNNIVGLFPCVRWIPTNVEWLSGWNSFAMSFDTNGTPTFYLNGVSVYVSPGTNAAGVSNLYYLGRNIGDEASPSERAFEGDISNFQIYNRSLTSAQVLQNYYGANIVTSNLLFNYDAGNLISYPKSGTTVRNLKSLSTNVGTLNNGVGFNNANGGYFTFDGTDDNINIGTVGGYSNQLTCESWFRTTSSATWKNMICGPVGDIIYTVNGNKINFGSQGSNPIPHDNLSNTIVNTGAWFHACVTYNGATVNIYINGVLDATYSETGSQTPGNLRIGSNDAGSSEFFSGDLPIVRLYNRALTQVEVIQNFNAQKARFGR
jgi:hypothetical protein